MPLRNYFRSLVVKNPEQANYIAEPPSPRRLTAASQTVINEELAASSDLQPPYEIKALTARARHFQERTKEKHRIQWQIKAFEEYISRLVAEKDFYRQERDFFRTLSGYFDRIRKLSTMT
ncbi:MAG: hypothetical protein Q9166_006041 [cf. Caloplaca sp. 2 TL-2023]